MSNSCLQCDDDTYLLSREGFDYTERRCHGLLDFPLEKLANQANIEAEKNKVSYHVTVIKCRF